MSVAYRGPSTAEALQSGFDPRKSRCLRCCPLVDERLDDRAVHLGFPCKARNAAEKRAKSGFFAYSPIAGPSAAGHANFAALFAKRAKRLKRYMA